MSNFPNDLPGSDWANFYDKPASTVGTHPPQFPRLNALPGYREEPLQPPYIIWDSRSWEVDTDILHNLGSAGDIFDLHVEWEGSENPITTGRALPYAYIISYKTLNWDNSFGTTPNPPGGFPTGIADIGGGACDGAYTMMVAFSPTFNVHQGDNLNYQYVEIDLLSNFELADGGGASIAQNMLGDNEDDLGEGIGNAIFHEWYDSMSYCQWLGQTPSPPDPQWFGHDLAGKLVTITADPWEGKYWVWIDHELIQYYDIWGDFNPPVGSGQMNFIDFTDNCLANDSLQDNELFHELFLYFGGVEGSWVYYPGAAWHTVVGTAFFRGHPTHADISEWYEYFYPEGQTYQPHYGSLPINRTALANTASHTFDWVVPEIDHNPEIGQYAITEILIYIVTSSGAEANIGTQDIWAMVPCQGGDTLTCELGGGGGQSVVNGLGGWPDGGAGGISITTGTIGGGGGGSTKIYLNGNLVIHAPGGGGGPSTSIGGALSNTQGARCAMPENEWADGLPQPGSAFPNLTHRGKGGTTSAPGAGGTGGGNAGVGSVGGAGGTSSGGGRTGGGGGGGGRFGGGGGGFDGTLPMGGGSGSWWWDSSVSMFNELLPAGNTDSNTNSAISFFNEGRSASVEIFYPTHTNY